jgi:hypothetical protein
VNPAWVALLRWGILVSPARTATLSETFVKIFCACLFLAGAMAAPECRAQSTDHFKTYTSPDSAWRFTYPGDFPLCTKDNLEPCNTTYIPLCQDPLVCVLYRGDFGDTTFEGAGFQVREIKTKNGEPTADICVSPSAEDSFLISAEQPVETIGGIRFVHGISGGAAMGHSNSVDLYRAFHNGRCYELSTSETATNPMVYDPPKKALMPSQEKKVSDAMSEILHSFRFLN